MRTPTLLSTVRVGLAILGLSLAFLLPTPRAVAQDNGSFFFVQLSDPQFGFFNGDRSFEQETANLEFIVASLNRLKPAFVVVTGDLTNKDGDPAQIAEYKRITAKLDSTIPLYSAPGNHDLMTETTPETLALYRKNYGRDYYSFRFKDTAGIVLNSNLFTATAKVQKDSEDMEAWLKAELKKLKDEGATRIIVFQHHPFFLERADEADRTGYNNIPTQRRAPILALLKEYGVSQIFAGHLHRNNVVTDSGIEMVATSAAGRPLGADPSGIRVVIVRPTGVEHTFYGLGSIPTAISLNPAGQRGGGRGGPGGPPAPQASPAPAQGR